MRNRTTKSVLLLGFAVLLFGLSSCSGARETSVNVLRPAEINFPSSIQSFVVINRTVPERRGWNAVESILSGEIPGQDREGAFAAVEYLAQGINSSPRFSATPARVEIKSNPDKPLDWDVIERLCKKYGTDAAVVLEAMDSDSFSQVFDGEIDRQMNVTLFWRVYDPIKKIIVDEQTSRLRGRDFDPVGLSIFSTIPQRYRMLSALCYDAGLRYTRKIAPTYVDESRTIYKKGKGHKELKKAYMLAQRGKWEKAIEIWDSVSDSDESKTAAKAAFNLALASEQLGDLENAQEWLDYSENLWTKNNRVVDYGNTLARRSAELERVADQMARVKSTENENDLDALNSDESKQETNK